MPPRSPYDSRTALLVVDPYNDFISEGGKFWPQIKDVAEQVGTIANLKAVIASVRAAGIPVFIVPHKRWEPGDFKDWDHANPYQQGAAAMQLFAKDSWGGEWHPDLHPHLEDVVVKEHWGSSGFANTDLDMRLKQKGVTHVIVVGLLANTCIETTSKFAVELGYHVTLVRDATAATSHDRMHAAHVLNGPTYAHAILTTTDLVELLGSEDDPRSHPAIG